MVPNDDPPELYGAMTYFSFLFWFLVLPLVGLGWLHWRDRRRGLALPAALRARHPGAVIVALVVVALVYTTPWDNYLVATDTWWYDPQRVVEPWVIGFVPLEEYCFFVLQTVLTGGWMVWLARRLGPSSASRRPGGLRWLGVLALGAVWAWSVYALVWGDVGLRYLGLELVWAVPPVALQVGFGADILWRWRRPVAAAIGTTTLWLAGADALAIRAGIWTISPEQTTGWMLPGGLPVEEAVFFLLTNVLVVFGLTLVIARDSQARAARLPLLTGLARSETERGDRPGGGSRQRDAANAVRLDRDVGVALTPGGGRSARRSTGASRPDTGPGS